jgi:heterodisulfide reductase subunit B
MPLSYFPGCSLSTSAKTYDVSGRAVAAELGTPFEELPDWQCCGATFPLATDNVMALIAPARLLAKTQQAGGHTTTLCAICYHVLKRAQAFFESDPDALERINWFTEEPYDGRARISHYLELLRDEYGWDTVAEHVRRPLTGLRVAPYYGCLLLRPESEIGLDDADEPSVLHDCLAALGCEVIDFPYGLECCGSYLAVSQPDLPRVLSRDIVASARASGADAIATACPLCQYNLDHSQIVADPAGATAEEPLPILYFTQLMAFALGLGPEVTGLAHDIVDHLALRGRREGPVTTSETA